MANNVIPMYSKISIVDLFDNMNRQQMNVNKSVSDCIHALKTKYDILKACVICLFLVSITMIISFYWAINEFQTKIQPEIEQKYPVPVEQLKEV